MNARQFMNQPHLFADLSQDFLRISRGGESIELPLDREVDGSLTDSCKREITARLQSFISRKSWQPRARVYCGIGARGVSLRRLFLPTGNADEVEKLLPFQIEREFPLPPDQLAWGAQPLKSADPRFKPVNGKTEFLVVAVKKRALEEYAAILADAGAVTTFTLAALNRTYVCPQPAGTYSVLAIERNYSELITIDAGMPVAVRVLPWGKENLALSEQTTRASTGAVLVASDPVASFGGTVPPVPQPAANGLDTLVGLLGTQSLGRALYLTGLSDLPDSSGCTTQLASRLGNGIECRAVEVSKLPGASCAVMGLQRAVDGQSGSPPLVLQLKQVRGKSKLPPQEQLKWAGIAAGLLLLALLLPYAEALLLKTHLANKLLAIKSDQTRLAVIDRELDFLQYLQANQPPYLDAMLVLAKSAPQGTRFDSVSMNRRGEITLRGSLRDGQQVADLRSKLIASGFFASVAVEEQAPTPDRQKVNVRMTAQWKPVGERISPPAEPAAASAQQKPHSMSQPSVQMPASAPPGPGPSSAPPRETKR
jgi:hypothetical protein